MNSLPRPNGFGQFLTAYHNSRPVFINFNQDNLRLYDFETMKELGKIGFKSSVSKVLIPRMKPVLDLRFVVITEDQFSHLIVYKKNNLSISASADLNQSSTISMLLLLDKALHSYILSENGMVISLSKKKVQKRSLAWPPKSMTNIHRLMPCEKFAGQKILAPNSAAFLAYHYKGEDVLISSWIYKFDTGEIMNGPITLQSSPLSIYLSTNYFWHANEVFTINPFKKIGDLPDIMTSSQYYGNTCLVANTKNEVFRLTESGISKIGELADGIAILEGNDTDYMTISYNGTITSARSKQSIKMHPKFEPAAFVGCIVLPNEPKTKFLNLKEPSPKPLTAVSLDGKLLKSNSGGKWTSPSEVIAWNYKRDGNYDYVIIASAATVNILKSHLKNPSILPVTEANWEAPITAVAISSKTFAVADTNNRISIQQFVGEEFQFSFTAALPCVALSISSDNCASGHTDGSLILTSLKEKQAVATLHPFRVPIKNIIHVDAIKVVVEWGDTATEVTPTSFDIIKAPEFPGSRLVGFENSLISIATATDISVFSFADRRLLGRVPMPVKALATCKRRISCLTVKNELVILYFHRQLKIETQKLLDVIDPISVHMTSEHVYVLSRGSVSVYEYSGKFVDKLQFTSPPRCASASESSFFIGFSRFLWLVEGVQTKKIPHDKTNMFALAAVDDTRCVVATSSRAILYDVAANSQSALAKFEKRIVGIRCYSTKIDGPVDRVAGVFGDDTVASWDIFPKKK